jgi:hypothetical protein
MRLKNIQKDVQFYVRDSLRIMLDIAVQNLPIWYWQKVTGLPIPTLEEKQNAIAQIEAMKIVGQEPDMEMIADTQAATWEDVMDVLQNDYIRSYAIDIETNSTLDVEATEDKKLVSDFMNAMAQFMNGMAPMIEKGIMPFGAARSMLLAISQRYRFGREVEEEIKSMTEPKGNPEAKKAQQQMQEAQKKFEADKKKATEDLDARAKKVESDMMKLKYEQESFKQEKMFEEKLIQIKKDQTQSEIETMLTKMFDKNERNIQSQVDKFAARIEKGA